MRVKIMDASLIRRYGGAIVEMNEGVAFSLQKQGKVKIIESASEDELPDSGSVLVFSSSKEEKKKNKRVPDVDEPIFPQITA